MKVKFAHTNIIAKDWRRLAQFYVDVFGCEPVYPERDLSGSWIDKVTNIKDVHIRGIHLRLPGFPDGPTLEIFQYNHSVDSVELPAINKVGLAHLAFAVEDVHLFMQKAIRFGGSSLGDLVEKEITGVGILTIIYVRDPEGNIIELQSWR